MILDSEAILVGKVNKTHGTQGELSVSFFDDAVIDAIDVGSCLLLRVDGIFVPFFVDAVRPRGDGALLISFEGEDSKQDVARFVGYDVYMPSADVPELLNGCDDGLYAAQLIGYKAISADGRVIGDISDIDDTTDNPLFVITTDDGNQILIPIADDFIDDLDTDSKVVTLSLPDGLIDINN